MHAGRRPVAAVLAAIVAICAGILSAAQPEEKFKTRLSPVAMDFSMQSTVAGEGSVSAVLSGNKLTISGTFKGLKSPATTAQLHEGLAPGVRGPVRFDLEVSSATSGTISGSVDLRADQVEALRKGKFYVQVNSEKAPQGNLWGWLMH